MREQSVPRSWVDDLVEVEFDEDDRDLFAIDDPLTRVRQLQEYFYPRLSRMLTSATRLIHELYGSDALAGLTQMRRPQPKDSAKEVTPFKEVRIGLVGARVPEGLVALGTDGRKLQYGLSGLWFEVFARGTIAVTHVPVIYRADARFLSRVEKLFNSQSGEIQCLCTAHFVSSAATLRFEPLSSAFSRPYLEDRGPIFSAGICFPVDAETGLKRLVATFVALFPLLRAVTDLSVGRKPTLGKDIQTYFEWWEDNLLPIVIPERLQLPAVRSPQGASSKKPLALPASQIADRRRWSVLMRDKWTCRSCGRTTKEHAVTLHVDHITPRSLGGTDDESNLQTLCSQCNLGKSNLDATDLRARIP